MVPRTQTTQAGDARYVLLPATLYTTTDTSVTPDPAVGPWLTDYFTPRLQQVGGCVEWLGPYFVAFTAGRDGVPTDGIRINTRTGDTYLLYRTIVDGVAYRGLLTGRVSDISLDSSAAGFAFYFTGCHVDTPPHPSLPPKVEDAHFTFGTSLTLDKY
jgi:hypothetical protein